MGLEGFSEEGYRKGEGTLLELQDTGLLPQEAEPGKTTLVDAHNEFNELIHLAILSTVRHH